MTLSAETKQRIASLIGSDRVVVFMKGSRRMPQCGFSAQVVQILDSHLPSYTTVDVLQDPEIRQGIKDFTNWPTIPQVYVDGEFGSAAAGSPASRYAWQRQPPRSFSFSGQDAHGSFIQPVPR